MVKIVNLVLCNFHHNKLKKKTTVLNLTPQLLNRNVKGWNCEYAILTTFLCHFYLL